jgi:hypothetical protein
MARIVSTGKTISTSEYLEKRTKEKRKFQIIVSGIVLVLVILAIFLSRLSNLQIKNVVVMGAAATGEDVVREKVRETLSGHYLWLVPHSNALLYRKGKIESVLREEFPRFSNIDISLSGLETLEISVTEREPFALYCAGSELCWFVDREGFIFSVAPSFSDGVYFVYNQGEFIGEPLGKHFLNPQEFMNLSQFIEALHSLGFKPLSLSLRGKDRILKLESGGEVIWGGESDLGRTLNNLESFLNSPAIKSEKDFLNRISELDLSTEDKVFYKFKN